MHAHSPTLCRLLRVIEDHADIEPGWASISQAQLAACADLTLDELRAALVVLQRDHAVYVHRPGNGRPNLYYVYPEAAPPEEPEAERGLYVIEGGAS